jgi:hypothetical protein
VNQLMTPGQTEYRDFGPLNIRIDRHDEGVTITVTHHDILNRQFTNLTEGRGYLALLRDHATAGTPMWLIEAAAGAWTSAAVVDQADKELIASINATMDAMQPEPVDVSDIVEGDGYQAERRKAREQAARFATRSQVHLQPPTEAELDRIRQHRNGIVTTAPGQPWTLLRAIHRRGLGDIHEVHGRHVIASVRLNARGLALVESGSVAA